MSISRKDFFCQSLFSLGKTAIDIAGTLKGGITVETVVIQEPAPPEEPRPEMCAATFNERCLARNCSCFACVERCRSQAIMVVSEGIRIDESRCTGCGTCEYVCPVNPKAVILQPRTKAIETVAQNADNNTVKGE
jgi:ferredoxin